MKKLQHKRTQLIVNAATKDYSDPRWRNNLSRWMDINDAIRKLNEQVSSPSSFSFTTHPQDV